MDPNALLARLLEIAGELEDDRRAALADCAVELADGLLALDQWLSAGGFLPQRWDGPPLRVTGAGL